MLNKNVFTNLQAAAKLKQTEGVVVLTVCSPNMKDDKAEDGATTPGEALKEISRIR